MAAINSQRVGQLAFDFLGTKPIEVVLSESPLSPDARLLPIRQFDERVHFT
jgi:hypothetical protein